MFVINQELDQMFTYLLLVGAIILFNIGCSYKDEADTEDEAENSKV